MLSVDNLHRRVVLGCEIKHEVVPGGFAAEEWMNGERGRDVGVEGKRRSDTGPGRGRIRLGGWYVPRI